MASPVAGRLVGMSYCAGESHLTPSHPTGSQNSIAFPSGSCIRAKRPMPSISLSWLTSMSTDYSCAIIASRSATRKFSMKVLSAAK